MDAYQNIRMKRNYRFGEFCFHAHKHNRSVTFSDQFFRLKIVQTDFAYFVYLNSNFCLSRSIKTLKPSIFIQDYLSEIIKLIIESNPIDWFNDNSSKQYYNKICNTSIALFL